MTATDIQDAQAAPQPMTSERTASSVAGSGAQPAANPASAAKIRQVRNKRSYPTLRTITALILREMTTSYGRSPGGYLWAVLEPAAGTAFLTAIFSLGFRHPALGSDFAIFYASGLIPFFAYGTVSGKVGTAILYSKALLVYPAVTYLDALVARFILTVMTQAMVAYIVFTFIIVVLENAVSISFGPILMAFSMTYALGMGIGTLNGFLFSVFPLWQRAFSILTRPLFIASGIFFLFDTVPQPWRDYLWYNPLVHVVGLCRSGFYARYDANYASPLYVFSIAAICFVVGLLFLHRYHRDILHN